MLKRVASIFLTVLLAAGFTLSVTLKMAHAYLEPSSLIYFFQMLVAAAFISLFMAKVFWTNISNRLSRFLSILKDAKAKPK